MNRLHRSSIWIASLVLLLGASAPAVEAPEPPGSIEFDGENLFTTAKGTFHRWRITDARIDRDAPGESFVEVEVDVASLDTGIQRRDDHLRSEDFFEVEKWPTASVRVHDVRAKGESESGRPLYAATFDLRVRDVEQRLEGEFEVVSEEPLAIEGGLTLDRVELGVGEAPGRFNPMAVRREVPVRFRASLPVEGR